jgi:hypothetical protein
VTSGSSLSLAQVPKEKHAMADTTGSCLCGAVAFQITGQLRPVIACHCHQCRKQTGAYMSSTAAKDEQFRFTETRGLEWYRSSDTGRRGFCEQCGSVLFWKGDEYDYIAIAAGSIDGKLGVTLRPVWRRCHEATRNRCSRRRAEVRQSRPTHILGRDQRLRAPATREGRSFSADNLMPKFI